MWLFDLSLFGTTIIVWNCAKFIIFQLCTHLIIYDIAKYFINCALAICDSAMFCQSSTVSQKKAKELITVWLAISVLFLVLLPYCSAQRIKVPVTRGYFPRTASGGVQNGLCRSNYGINGRPAVKTGRWGKLRTRKKKMAKTRNFNYDKEKTICWHWVMQQHLFVQVVCQKDGHFGLMFAWLSLCWNFVSNFIK